jgi:hypothetical protein
MSTIKNILFFFFLSISFAYSQNIIQKLRDSTDNAIDLSNFLTKKNGVLPVIVPITEPAVGFGVIGGGLFFLPKKGSNKQPDLITAAAGITTNKTWIIGGGYLGFWKGDKIRYRGVTGYGDINLNYYIFGKLPVNLHLKTFLFLQQANFRLGKSNFFIGGKYLLTHVQIPIFEEVGMIDIKDLELINSGVSLITEYDNLDNFLSPTKGLKVHLSYDQNHKIFGSDKNWGKFNFYTHYYHPVNDRWTPKIRLEAVLATGDIPFYAKPYVNLRGVPFLRYQGKIITVAETEQLFNLTPRWGLVGFTGIGAAFHSFENIHKNDFVWNAGGGIRYTIARTLGLKIGADVARGPEDWAFYVVIGSGWLR